MKVRVKLGRLAMRVEGDKWNAYYAMSDTMEGAVLLGSIAIGAVVDRPERKQAFMDLMKDIVSEFLGDAAGGGPVLWDQSTIAPERERSGSA